MGVLNVNASQNHQNRAPNREYGAEGELKRQFRHLDLRRGRTWRPKKEKKAKSEKRENGGSPKS
jgi:hypothetical protein